MYMIYLNIHIVHFFFAEFVDTHDRHTHTHTHTCTDICTFYMLVCAEVAEPKGTKTAKGSKEVTKKKK